MLFPGLKCSEELLEAFRPSRGGIMKRVQARAVAVRDYTARKFLLASLLLIGTYLAIVPILHRLAE